MVNSNVADAVKRLKLADRILPLTTLLELGADELIVNIEMVLLDTVLLLIVPERDNQCVYCVKGICKCIKAEDWQKECPTNGMKSNNVCKSETQ